MNQLLSIIELSCILSLVTLAAVFTFRFAGFPDLSVDGVFALGSVVFAKSILIGFSPITAVCVAAIFGFVAGVVTSTISIKLKIHPLLASVLVLTILYTINLKILGRSNQPLYNLSFSIFNFQIPELILFVTITICILLFFYKLFSSEFGSALRITGSSSNFLISVGRNVKLYQILLIAMAGSLVSISGSLLSFYYGFSDVSIGNGIIIIGIASLIIGEKILGNFPLYVQIIGVLIGIIIYELSSGLALSMGFSPNDFKLATGVITIGLLAFGRKEERLFIA